MTKKAKRKSIKTGYRTAEERRNTTISVGFAALHGSCPKPVPESMDIESLPRITKSDRKRLQRKRKEQELEEYKRENNKRVIYPSDLWYLVGRFVTPEYVKTFSMICVDAYKVTCSKQFWLGLYDRYVTDHKDLPSHLKPHSITTNVGLKTRVIRSLFYKHTPFVDERLARVPLADAPPGISEKSLMVETHWWKKLISVKSHIYVWRLHFKLINFDKPHRKSNSKLLKSTNDQELMHYNPEERFSLLQVTAPSYAHIPHNVFAMCLTNVSVGISRNLKSQRVKLFFHEYRPHAKYLDSQATVLTIDPAFDVELLNWWDSDYPHPFDR